MLLYRQLVEQHGRFGDIGKRRTVALRILLQRNAVHLHLADLRLHKSKNMLDCRAFPGTIQADKPDHFTCLHIKGDVMQHGSSGAVAAC
ncbi:hypothetical protein D3C78_846780 [compost metagenome]